MYICEVVLLPLVHLSAEMGADSTCLLLGVYPSHTVVSLPCQGVAFAWCGACRRFMSPQAATCDDILPISAPGQKFQCPEETTQYNPNQNKITPPNEQKCCMVRRG